MSVPENRLVIGAIDLPKVRFIVLPSSALQNFVQRNLSVNLARHARVLLAVALASEGST